MNSLRTYALVRLRNRGFGRDADRRFHAKLSTSFRTRPSRAGRGSRSPPSAASNPKLQWRVDTAQQALICTGDGGHEWLRYDRELGDFELQVDWRFTPARRREALQQRHRRAHVALRRDLAPGADRDHRRLSVRRDLH